MASDLRLPQRDINVKWVDGISISTQPIPVEIKSSDITLNVTEIAFGYVGIEDQLGNKLVINADGSINVAGGSGPASSVSVTSSVLPTGAAADATVASGNTTLTGIHTDTTAIKNSLAGTIAVSGTFWQATQPVSGTFWQATQPVSIAASVAVTGTFWQATQPVSIATMPTTPVTGTFWQATQPVSGTFFQATQPVSLATLPALVAGSAIIGKVGIDQTTPGTTNLIQDTGTTWGNSANRQTWTFSAVGVAGVTTEALLSSVASTANVAAAGATSYTVPVGKTLRITSLHIDVFNTSTVASRGALTVRAVPPAGTLTASSPIVHRQVAQVIGALAGNAGSDDISLPEGFTLPAGSIVGVSQLCLATTCTVSFCLTGYLY